MKRWLGLFLILVTMATVVVAVKEHWRRAQERAELNEQMPYRWDPRPTQILVREIIDNGDRSKERCLVVKRFGQANDYGERYALALLSRPPNDKSATWGRPMIVGRIGPGGQMLPALFSSECYEEAPTDEEIAAFLRLYSWDHALKPWRAYTSESYID